MLTKEKFTEAITNTIAEKNILNHPFYQKWNEGKLTIDELKTYAKQYYRFVEHFPMFVSSVHSNCTNPQVRAMILENLADEEGYKTNVSDHPALWLNFCKSLDIDVDMVKNNKSVVPEVQKMVDGFYSLCRSNDYRLGLAALLAYEFQIPEVSRIKIEGLKKFYGISSPEAIEFFTVHEQADIYHSRDEMDAIVNNCKTEKEQKKVLGVIKKSASLYWQMLDGMYVN
jgi:pyrroloquinoline-quinone synthase